MKDPCEPKAILLVDQNDHDVGRFGRAAKHSCNASVHRVTSGTDAISYLIRQESAPDALLPNLIIMEWNLPSGDAFSLLRFVNATDGFKSIPTIILTGIDSPEQIEWARALGAESVFLKPTDIDGMEKLVFALCEVYIHFAIPPPHTEGELALAR